MWKQPESMRGCQEGRRNKQELLELKRTIAELKSPLGGRVELERAKGGIANLRIG